MASIPSLHSFRSLLALPEAGRIGLLLLGALYTIGLIIVNFDLGKNGFVTLDLARAEYVLAGVLWAFLSVSTVAALRVAAGQLSEHPARTKVRRFVAGFVTVMVWFGVIVFLVTELSFGSLPIFRPRTWFAVGVVLLNGTVLASTLKAWLKIADEESVTLRHLFRATPTGMTPVASVVFLVVALSLYAEVVFPELPRAIGGGRKPMVRLLPKPESRQSMASLLPNAEGGSLDGRMALRQAA